MKPLNSATVSVTVVITISVAVAVLFPVFTHAPDKDRRPVRPEIQAQMDAAKRLLDEGRQAYRNGDITVAEDKLQECLKTNTVWSDLAAKQLARIYEQQGQPEKAFEAYRQAFGPLTHSYSDFPSDVEALARYGLLAQKYGQQTEAARVYGMARERLHPDPALPLTTGFDPQASDPARLRSALQIVRGVELRAQGKSSDALAAFSDAARQAPDDPVAQLCLGNALQRAGRSTQARAALQQAVRLGSGPVQAAAEQALK